MLTSPPNHANLTPSGYKNERSLNAVDYAMTPNAQSMAREESGTYILPTDESESLIGASLLIKTP